MKINSINCNEIVQLLSGYDPHKQQETSMEVVKFIKKDSRKTRLSFPLLSLKVIQPVIQFSQSGFGQTVGGQPFQFRNGFRGYGFQEP